MRSFDDPDPPFLPLRSEPVRREEVRFVHGYPRQCVLLTMPPGTFHCEKGPYSWLLIADPDLWRSVWNEVSAELEADYTNQLRRCEASPQFAALFGAHRTTLQPFQLWWGGTSQYSCDYCGISYFGGTLTGNERVCICSNRCEHERRKEQQRDWRLRHGPRDYRQANAGRAARRAAIRADRKCEHCSAPIEASRSTKRFCSDICRVKAHRAAQNPLGASLVHEPAKNRDRYQAPASACRRCR